MGTSGSVVAVILGTDTSDVVTALVAGYAAAVSTAVAAWQVRLSRSRVKVELDFSVLVGGQNVVLFTLTNPRDHAVKITHLGIRPSWWRSRRGQPSMFIGHPEPLPAPGTFVVPARDGVNLHVERGTLHKYAGQRVRAVVRTSAGDGFKSSRVRVPQDEAAKAAVT